MRVTLRDIAGRAEVSINTVSRALRDCDDISVAQRARICTLAETMGYEPDPALSALAAYRQRMRVRADFATLAVVSFWERPDLWLKTTSAGRAFWNGAEARARQFGYRLELFWAGSVGMNMRRASDVLQYRGIRGLILLPLPPDARRLRLELKWDAFSVVTIERNESLPTFLYVAPNYYAAMTLVWQQLWRRGYRRPGLILNEDLAGRSHHQWEAGMLLEQQRSLGATEQAAVLVHPAGAAYSQVRDLVDGWWKRFQPDAVITRTNLAPRLLADCARAPRDCGIASLNIGDDEFGSVEVSGIDQQRRAMGASAVDLVSTLLMRSQRGPEALTQGVVVDGVWHEGDTLRPATRRR